MKFVKILTLSFYYSFFPFYSIAMSYEETNYEIVKKEKSFEIRKYSDRLAVETIETGSVSNFRKLFNYISGKNENSEKIKMTTPVTQVEKNGIISMQFYLPSKYNLKNVPSPIRNDVNILIIEGGYYAVLRYSGRASDRNFIKHNSILQNELEKSNILIISPPIRATYDSPFTLPMNRRNEAMFKIDFNKY